MDENISYMEGMRASLKKLSFKIDPALIAKIIALIEKREKESAESE